PLGLTVGPDGNLWFTDAGENLQATGGAAAPPKQIGRFHLADGSLSFNPDTDWFPNGENGSVPVALTNSGDNNLWFANSGTDANLWFTIQQSKTIGRMTPGGAFTEFTPPATLPGLAGIATGSDGNLYVTAEGAATPNPSQLNRPIMAGNGLLARVTPAGVITPIPAPAGKFSPNAIVNGPDGNLWLTDVKGNMVWRFNPLTSVFTSFPVPTQSAFSGNVPPTGI